MAYTHLKAFEKNGMRANEKRPRGLFEYETFGQAVKEFIGAILVAGVLYIILNLILGWN